LPCSSAIFPWVTLGLVCLLARELSSRGYVQVPLSPDASQETQSSRTSVLRELRALVLGAYAVGSLMVKQRVWMKFFSSSNRPLEAMRTLSVEPSLHRSLAL
jgi:hypothetical protein